MEAGAGWGLVFRYRHEAMQDRGAGRRADLPFAPQDAGQSLLLHVRPKRRNPRIKRIQPPRWIGEKAWDGWDGVPIQIHSLCYTPGHVISTNGTGYEYGTPDNASGR